LLVFYHFNQEYDAAQRKDAVQRDNKKDIRKFSVENDLSSERMEDLKRRVKETESQVIFV